MSDKDKIDKRMISDLARILNDTNLTEIEVEHGELRIRVSRSGTMMQAPMMMPAPAPVAAPAPAPAPAAPVADAAPAAGSGIDLKNAVTSPMVGTAYLSPSPGSDPFVSVGDSVKEGQTLLIIEAMKTMNKIVAPRAGKVTAIIIDDAQPVEYGEPLLVIA